MKQIIAVIKPFLAEKVLGALWQRGIDQVTIREVKGYGRQKSYLSQYKDNEYSIAFLPKVEICVWVDDEEADSVMKMIVDHSRTGRMGDGKIFCLQVLTVKE